MALNSKLAVLDQIYSVYDEFVARLDIACKKYCAGCCTRNVTLTTLEGYFITTHMISSGESSLFENIESALPKKRFQPLTTTNRLADLSMKGEDFPEEKHHDSNERCPLLKDNLCPIYPVRPFACRCFVSKKDCRKQGYAEVDPFVLSVNNLFLQVIEHVDFQGFSGNLIDVLKFMASETNRHNYKNNTLNHPGSGLIPNLNITVLMIPPEHRIEITPILNALQNIKPDL
jgi:Fe-S-cluster containining protein